MNDFIVHSNIGEFQSKKIQQLVHSYGGETQKRFAYTPEQQCFMERGGRTIKDMASSMIVVAGLSEPYWACAQDYAKIIYNRKVRPYGESNALKSPDDINFGVPHDMQLFQPFGCKAYINIAKEVRRKNHKRRAELAIFVGWQCT